MSLQSFGIVTVTAAGTPVQATANVLPALQTGEPVQLQTVRIQAMPGNTGIGYVFAGMTATPADHRTDGVGLIGVIPAPASSTSGPFGSVEFTIPVIPNGINLRNIWLDTSVNGSKFIVSGTVG